MNIIIINGQRWQFTAGTVLSYDQVKRLTSARWGNRSPTITYRANSSPHATQGILAPGEEVTITEGMVMNCYDTGNA